MYALIHVIPLYVIVCMERVHVCVRAHACLCVCVEGLLEDYGLRVRSRFFPLQTMHYSTEGELGWLSILYAFRCKSIIQVIYQYHQIDSFVKWCSIFIMIHAYGVKECT